MLYFAIIFLERYDDMKNKNTIIITEEMINSDPYGYTYKEICDCVGEKKARSLMHALYKEKPQKKYQTMSINDIYNGGDTRKYSFKLRMVTALKLFASREKQV